MRGIGIGLGVLLIVTACAEPPRPAAVASGEATGETAGVPGAVALHGQVVVAHPPGTEDAVAKVRHEAARRCPGGFSIRSLHTTTPTATDFADRLLNYEAVVDCTPELKG